MAQARNRPVTNNGTIDCPRCEEKQPAVVVIQDEDGAPTIVCCLSCRQLFRVEQVGWCDK